VGDWRTDDDDDEDDDNDDDRLERETKLSQRSPSRAHQGNHQRIVTRNHDDDDDDDDDERAPERVGQTLLYFWGDQGGVDAPRSGEESGGASVRW